MSGSLCYCTGKGRIVVTRPVASKRPRTGDRIKLTVNLDVSPRSPISFQWYLNDVLDHSLTHRIKDIYVVFEAKVSKIPFLCKFRYL